MLVFWEFYIRTLLLNGLPRSLLNDVHLLRLN